MSKDNSTATEGGRVDCPKPTHSNGLLPIRSTVDRTLEYPLWPNPCGYWCKKIGGKVRYFGAWKRGVTAEAAEQMYAERRQALEDGLTPDVDKPDGGIRLKDLLNKYRQHKKTRWQDGDISERTFQGAEDACVFVYKNLDGNRKVSDLGPSDFAHLRKRLQQRSRKGKSKSPIILGNWIGRIRSVFKYALKNGLIEHAVRFGEDFEKPSARNVREYKQGRVDEIKGQGADPTFSSDEIRAMLHAAKQPLKAMILLGINCGLGNSDIAHLRRDHLNLETGWLDYVRPKTGVTRKAKLWPETMQAINEWLEVRPDHKDPAHARLVFTTKRGHWWGRHPNPLSHEMRKLLDKLKINASRNFYTLRHTFRTEGGKTGDDNAISWAMGHVIPGMGAHYVKYVHDDRLAAIAQIVHDWLWPEPAKPAKAARKGKVKR
ncbi:MAG: tyrosine-type recombinase/integrase [Gemmataceae bacterium]